MRLPRLRFSLFTLLALPTMFALGWGTGWWSRERNYNRDVYAAADEMAFHSGAIYMPEVGLIRISGPKRYSDRFKAMSPAAQAELERRLQYYHEEVDASFNPPRPGLSDSLREVITRDHAGTTADEERAKRVEQNAADDAKRKAFFEKN